MVLAGADGRVIHQLVGDATNVNLGRFFVAGMGDVDGDTRVDLLLSAASGDTVYLVST